jgi:hypothetical protein
MMPKEPFLMTSNGSYASKKDEEDMEMRKVMKVLVDNINESYCGLEH